MVENAARYPINGELIRQLRQDRQLSQEEAAYKIGISAKTLAMFENGDYDSVGSQDRVNRWRNLGLIAKFYGCSGWKTLVRLPGPSTPVEIGEENPTGDSDLEPPGCSYNPRWYVQRPAQQTDMLQALSMAGVPAILQGPSGLGKTQLCGWLTLFLEQDRAAYRGARSVALSLGTFETEELGHVGRLLAGIGQRILRAIDIDSAEERLTAAGQRPGSEKDRLTWIMEQYVLPKDGIMLLCLEQVDCLWGLPSQNDFFAVLRLWMEDTSPIWSSLRLVVSVSLEPALLESTDHSGFFSRTPPIVLSEFGAEQLGQLANIHGLRLGTRDLNTLVAWVGGHPYLSRLAVYWAVKLGMSVTEIMESPDLRQRVFRGHLLRVQSWLEEHRSCWRALDIHLGGQSGRVSSADHARLYRRGLLSEESSPGRLRYRLYDEHIRPLLSG